MFTFLKNTYWLMENCFLWILVIQLCSVGVYMEVTKYIADMQIDFIEWLRPDFNCMCFILVIVTGYVAEC